MKSPELRLLHFADSVRAALIHFGHTHNMALVKPQELDEIYNEACEIIGEITDYRDYKEPPENTSK